MSQYIDYKLSSETFITFLEIIKMTCFIRVNFLIVL